MLQNSNIFIYQKHAVNLQICVNESCRIVSLSIWFVFNEVMSSVSQKASGTSSLAVGGSRC